MGLLSALGRLMMVRMLLGPGRRGEFLLDVLIFEKVRIYDLEFHGG